ncbi:MAG: hypothetical protein ABIG37_03750 [Nanoarchaeota archaeon]|nr:hypothetical protein [Nanoarchaeota archaeon]
MEQGNPKFLKEKIINIIKSRGPSLPVHISKETGLQILFASAFLSELVSEKIIKVSNLKVGGSPLYLISGQEKQLEKFYNYLPGKEAEAFLLLKEKKVLKDEKQEPSIRVALRNIRDFAFPIILNFENQKKLFWRFHSFSEEELKNLFEKRTRKIETFEKIPKNLQKTYEEKKEKPLLEIQETKKIEKKKEKSEFVDRIISLLNQENIEILEEIEIKKKEFVSIIKINSGIGDLKFLLLAKDKKRVSENDLTIAMQKSQSNKMPVFFVSPGELDKKSKEYIKDYSNMVIFKKI